MYDLPDLPQYHLPELPMYDLPDLQGRRGKRGRKDGSRKPDNGFQLKAVFGNEAKTGPFGAPVEPW